MLNQPDVVIVAPCGFSLARAERELKRIEQRPEWRELPAVKDGAVVRCRRLRLLLAARAAA